MRLNLLYEDLDVLFLIVKSDHLVYMMVMLASSTVSIALFVNAS